MQYTGTTFIDEIMKEIGENITNSNYRVFVLNWLQEAFDIAVAELEGHKFLNCVVDLNTVASTASYSAVSDSLIPGNIIAIRNKTTNRPLQYIDIQDTKFSTWDLESEGDPQYYYSYGYSLTYATSLIYFYPIPNAAYALEVTFKLESYQFADSSAVLYIPRYILSCLRFYVRSKAFQREGDSENSKFEMELFFAQLKRQQKSKHEIAKINQLQITDLPNYSRSNGNGRRENYQYGFIGESLSPVGVSSITISVPTFMGQSGSPLTSAGTITLTFDQQTGRKFLASPSDGTLGDVDFRALVANDIPTHTHLSADITDLAVGNEFVDNVFRIKDNTDATKKISFQASGITTGTTRELTVQDASGTIALTSNKLSVFATTTSAELASVLSDETGTDKLVFNTSPTLVTPVLGAATATSINKVAITSPATSATLTIADGKTLTANASTTIGSISDQKLVYANGADNLTELTLGTNLSITAGTLNASGGVGATAFNDIGDSTGNGTVANAAYTNEWTFNSIAGATALKLSSTSTVAASNLQIIFEVALSGANSTSTQTTYASKFSNTHTGTSSTNVAIYGSASGGSNNYGLIIANGQIGFGTTAPYLVINPFDSPTAGTVCQISGFFSAQRSGHVGIHFYNGGGVAEWLIGQKSASHHIQFSKVISNQQYDMAELSTDGVFSACGLSTDIYSAGNSGTALTLNFNNGGIQKVTMTGNCTFTFSNPVAGVTYKVYLTQDATGSRTATWPATVKWPSATAPTLTTTASKTDIFEFTWDGTNYHGNTFGQNYS